MRKNRKEEVRKNKYGVIIHLVADDEVCDVCGGSTGEHTFLPGMCDAHTHGLKERGFTELQMVLRWDNEYIGYVLNTVAEKVIKGEIEEKNRALVRDFFGDGASIRLDRRTDNFGEDVYRIVIPDGSFRMPEESDEYPYNMQINSPYIKDHWGT